METTEKLNKAMLAALQHNDRKLAAKLADTILKYDNQYESAWMVVYTLTGSQGDFNSFKADFTQKYYLNATQSMENSETLWESNENIRATPRAISSKIESKNDLQDGIACSQCGRLNILEACFCGSCGEKLFQKRSPSSASSEPSPEPIIPLAASTMTSEHHDALMKDIFANLEETPVLLQVRSEGLQQINLSTEHAVAQEMISPIELRPDPAQVSCNLTSKDESTVLNSLEKVRKYKMMEMVPQVMDLLMKNHFYHRGTACQRNAFEVMDELGSSEQWVTFEKIIKHDYLRLFPFADVVAPALYRRSYIDKAIKVLKFALNGSVCEEFSLPPNIWTVLASHQIPEMTTVEALCKNIPNEIKAYDPKLQIGWALVWSSVNPIFLLVTGALTIAGNIIHNVSMRSRMYDQSLASASWMVNPEILLNLDPKYLTRPVAMMLVLHAYATSLAKLGKKQPSLLDQALEKFQKPVQRVILGLAQANNGLISSKNVLQSAAEDNYWPVRILAYEGLVTLREKTNDPLYPSIQNGLTDNDLRVALATASIMIATASSDYEPLILRAAGSPDAKRRLLFLTPLRELARGGNNAARHMLVNMTRSDPNSEVRDTAKNYLSALG